MLEVTTGATEAAGGKYWLLPPGAGLIRWLAGVADVGRADVRIPGQIRYGTGDLEDAVAGPSAVYFDPP